MFLLRGPVGTASNDYVGSGSNAIKCPPFVRRAVYLGCYAGTGRCRREPIGAERAAMNADRPIEILLDDARPGQERLRRFSAPAMVIQANEPGEVEPALGALEKARRGGKYVAGYFSYELGYVLEPRLHALLPKCRTVPLLWFGVFDDCEEFEGAAVNSMLEARVTGRAYGGPLAHGWAPDEYCGRFARVHELIDAGDIYQANLSFRSQFPIVGDSLWLYLKLRAQSKAAHGAFIADGHRSILSLSPELFFALSRTGEIVARPMKGTAARGSDVASDMAAHENLRNSAKDRAENLMIVDLLRNDLGRVAVTGSVSVRDLYTIETYPTVHQMVSTVCAQIKPETTIGDFAHALFPCGSVTGTPKIRAMEVIREMEPDPRGVYCGAIGYFAPDGSASLNVAIRTLTIAGRHGELGIGGAIVHDSRAGSEYAECLLKARYYEAARRPLELIETLRFSPASGFARKDMHLDRMARSASVFSIRFDRDAAVQEMTAAVTSAFNDQRVRLSLSEDGSFACTAVALPAAASLPWRYAISPIVMPSDDILLRHKTSWREAYDAEISRMHECDEVLFVNQYGRLTEGSRTNIFLHRDGRLITPPLRDGVLDGCLRRELIEERRCEECEIYPRDLENADEVLLGNSLRGLLSAVPSRSAGRA